MERTIQWLGTQAWCTWYSTEGFDFDLRMIADNFKSDILSAKRRNLVARHLLFISDVIFSKKCFSLGTYLDVRNYDQKFSQSSVNYE